MPLVPEESQADAATAAAGDEPPVKERLEDVPVSRMKIEAPPTDLCGSDGKVVCMTGAGDALLCYADCNSTRLMPSLKGVKVDVGIPRWPIAVSVAPRPGQREEDDLYLMHKPPERGGAMTSCFHVLRSWRWEALPPPPFAGTIGSHTVVDGGRTICVSSNAEGIGTYCFDTAEREWRHAGDWVLPAVQRQSREPRPPPRPLGGAVQGRATLLPVWDVRPQQRHGQQRPATKAAACVAGPCPASGLGGHMVGSRQPRLRQVLRC
jgi:hypothetical protein